MKVKVDFESIGTWLEPYIGHVFYVEKESNLQYQINIDYGYDKPRLVWVSKKYLTIEE